MRSSLLLLCLVLAACGEKTPPNTATTHEKSQPAPTAAPEPQVFLAPRALAFIRVGTAALRAEEANEVNLDTVRGKFLVFRRDGGMRFLYRKAVTDTVWTEIERALPEADSSGLSADWDSSDISLSFHDLDHHGAPEALVTYQTANYGTGSGTTSVCINLVDLSRDPLLLLSAVVKEEHEDLGHDNGRPEGRRNDADYERYTGWERTIRLGPDVQVGPATPLGTLEPSAQHNGLSPLTPLKTGRYRYTGGGLCRVGS